MNDPFEIKVTNDDDITIHQAKQPKNKVPSIEVYYGEDKITEKKEDYQIVICQDGKLAATLDTGTKRICY